MYKLTHLHLHTNVDSLTFTYKWASSVFSAFVCMRNSFICEIIHPHVTWLIHEWHMTRFFRDATYPCEWQNWSSVAAAAISNATSCCISDRYDSFTSVLHTRHTSFICKMMSSDVRRLIQTWQGMTPSHVPCSWFIWQAWFTSVAWLIHWLHDSSICDMIHPYVTWLIHKRYDSSTCCMTHPYVWHDSFASIIHLWHGSSICDMTHPYMTRLIHRWNDSSIRYILIHMRDMTHSYVWHDSFICVTW